MTVNGATQYVLPGQQAPACVECEEAVIGAILVNSDAFLLVAAFLKSSDFYILRNAYIWEALERIQERGDKADFIVVQEELKALGRLNDVGGPAYLLQLINNTPTSVHAEVYGRLVERAAIRRRLLVAADEIKAVALEEDLPIEKVITESETRLLNVTISYDERPPATMHDGVGRYFELVEATEHMPVGVSGLATGYDDFDELMDGLQGGSLNLFAGRPGRGKTSAALCMALKIAKRAALGEVDGGVYIWSGEMPEKQLIERLISIETGIGNQLLRRGLRAGGMNRMQIRRYVEANGRLSKLPIVIDDMPQISPRKLEARMKRAMRDMPGRKFALIVVDYVGLMTPGVKRENTEKEISYISKALKTLAGKYAPVLAAVQLNREIEKRKDPKPKLSDLRDSGSLEADADTVTFVYSTEKDKTKRVVLSHWLTEKNRHGDTGQIDMYFERAITRFSEKLPATISEDGRDFGSWLQSKA